MVEAPVRVLLVDDDEDEYIIVGNLLRSACAEKCKLKWAPTYEQALVAILAEECDVCLVDYRLGERNGLDLLAEIAGITGHPQVVLLTGEGDHELDVSAARAGAADYLVKGELTAPMLERSIRYASERGRTLKALREVRELAQLNLAKSAFVAAMSHEIRTPMNAILGMADMLWESPLDSDQRQYMEVLRRAGAGLLLLINDILDLSKIDGGYLKLERVEFDLEDVVDQAIELTAVKARPKGILLLSHFWPGLATAWIGDPTRLRQVLINLLGNAVKFTSWGEIVLTIKQPVSRPPGEIEFSVSDTGIGIPADKLETIFDDFTQADESTTRKYGGSGLGLGICRRLVEAMGGRLTASSSEGRGSTFRFTAHFDPAPGKARNIGLALGNSCCERVLLIDGSTTHCFILKETLQTWGLESDACRSSAEAIVRLKEALAGKKRYSLVLINELGATDYSGITLEIKRIAGSIPIVVLTPYARAGNITRCIDGTSVYAVKPVSRAQLLRLVSAALGKPNAPEAVPAGILDHGRQPVLRPASILVAEDSPDNRLLVEVFLKDSPYRLTFEEDGQAAVHRFTLSRFDLILMDIQMPVMDGLAATRAIRALEQEQGSPSIPIIALTAHASLADAARSAAAGCTAHLSKPISKRELLTAIRKFGSLEATCVEAPQAASS